MPPAGALRLRHGPNPAGDRGRVVAKAGASIPPAIDPGKAEQTRPRASRSFVQWCAPP